MRRTILTISLAVAALCGCQKPKTVETPPTAVRTIAAELTTVTNEVRYSGTVAPDTQVDLSFRIPGYVTQIATGPGGHELQEGDYVAAGTVLAHLRRSEYEARAAYAEAVASDTAAMVAALRAQAGEAEASFTQAARDFERASVLYAEKALTKANFDGAEAKRSGALARWDAAKAQMAAQQARVDGAGAQQRDASLNLNDTLLRAPFAGVVVAKRIARGSLVAAGTPAFTIADTRTVKISFGAPDTALRSFNKGDVLPVTSEATPNREFRGRLTSIAAAADPASRVFPVELSVDNASQALKVGMIATVTIRGVRDANSAPAIPLAAVVKSDRAGEYGVYAVESRDGAERVRLQSVTLGPVRGNSVVITAGLSPGQRIVAAAGLQLSDGERVRQIP